MDTEQQVREDKRTIPADTLRARLKLARMHAGDLTIREAADRCGLIHASWANWEKGMEPRGLVDIVDAISEGLGIDRDWLLFGGPLTQPEGRARALKRRLPAEGRRNTLRYASMPERMRRNVRPTGRNQDNRAPSSRRPRIMPRPLNAVS